MEVTDEYVENAFQWTRDSGDTEADAVWNAAHVGMKSIAFAAADIDGDVKISCTLTASSATYGSVTVDDNLDASHTPAELDANDIFVIENGDLKVTTSRGNAYVLENGALKASGAKLNGSITAETKLFASRPEDVVEFSYDHNGLRTQKKVTKPDGTVETTEYTLHGKLLTHLTRGSDKLHFFYDAQSRPAMVNFNGTFYSYAHNLQGDIVGIVDSAGTLVVEYRYDAWGKPTLVRTLTTAYAALAELNPFRYRGYVYDEEAGFNYLRSRYYDSERGRFMNLDYFIAIFRHPSMANLFLYCRNNSVNGRDDDGAFCVLPNIEFESHLIEPGYLEIDARDHTLVFDGLRLAGYTPNSYFTDYTKYGELLEYWTDASGRIIHVRHHTNHGYPKNHMTPHDHDVTYGENGEGKFSQGSTPNLEYKSGESANSDDEDSEGSDTKINADVIWPVFVFAILLGLFTGNPNLVPA